MQFLQVSWLDWALILLGLGLSFPSAFVSSVFMLLCILKFCLLHSLLYLLSWGWWDWRLTWLTNHCPLVLWHCWLGHLTFKIVPEMTYNVLSVTFNPTILYLLLPGSQLVAGLPPLGACHCWTCCMVSTDLESLGVVGRWCLVVMYWSIVQVLPFLLKTKGLQKILHDFIYNTCINQKVIERSWSVEEEPIKIT